MKGITRKNVLGEAKKKIESELRQNWEKLTIDYNVEINKTNPCPDKIETLQKSIEDAAKEFNDWKMSKKKKKKASIQWADDIQANLAKKPSKPQREIKDWDALYEIRNNHRKARPRASAWLQEGVLVTQRGSSMPMMVVSIRPNGMVQCLAGGMMKTLKDISLRPAFDNE